MRDIALAHLGPPGEARSTSRHITRRVARVPTANSSALSYMTPPAAVRLRVFFFFFFFFFYLRPPVRRAILFNELRRRNYGFRKRGRGIKNFFYCPYIYSKNKIQIDACRIAFNEGSPPGTRGRLLNGFFYECIQPRPIFFSIVFTSIFSAESL